MKTYKIDLKTEYGLATGKKELDISGGKMTQQPLRTQTWLDDCASFFRIYCEEEM